MKILIVEDQPAVAKALRLLFDLHDLASETTSSPDAALRAVERGDVDLVLQDMNFSPGATSGDEGVALFRALRAADPDLPVLLLTAWTSLETAVQLVKEGASDYLAKPWDDAKLVATVRNLLKIRVLKTENDRLRNERTRSRASLAREHDLRGIVYDSEAMHRIVFLAIQIATADVPVLITGPNGAGKEKIAEIVHANSRRKRKPLVKVNAGAIPDNLIESELFGAEAGAYTGSNRLRIGRFEAANGGTLFLDEIGNLSPAGQMKLLRVLQSGEFERLGSSETRTADVRALCATNTDLRQAIARGTFRQDLYFRLNVIEISVPPLRERREDVLPLAESFLASSKSLGDAARNALLAHDWPGNVRELHNRIQRATALSTADTITP
ncbi:MAG TPA: sigma-54 dependent transcriptional regulator, partial [Thermoanaerobaculia bacterium]|nr:sigma-54 dependent transcriptional regulator [Thermoanaerobaculia bacterium]